MKKYLVTDSIINSKIWKKSKGIIRVVTTSEGDYFRIQKNKKGKKPHDHHLFTKHYEYKEVNKGQER